MIRGTVIARPEVVVPLRIRGPGGAETDVDAVLDTGFNNTLTLPAAVIAALDLVREFDGSGLLADGTSIRYDVYSVEVDWDGAWRRVLVSAVGG